jgi:hypothetical protein
MIFLKYGLYWMIDRGAKVRLPIGKADCHRAYAGNA